MKTRFEKYKKVKFPGGGVTGKPDYTGMGIGFMKTSHTTEKEYYNPKVEKGITSGSPQMDFLYNNQWLYKVPGVKNIIKNQAAEEINKGTNPSMKIDLVNQYLNPKKGNLPKSQYKPTSDYLEFLPSYSVKGDFDKTNSDELPAFVNDVVNPDDPYSVGSELKYKDFLRDKKPIYNSMSHSSRMAAVLGVDLAGHKTGMAWDKKVNLPYMSISDAWDFSPDMYTKKYGTSTDIVYDKERDRQATKVQSTLLHKAGTPFKVYDRFYFNPDTKAYIPDDSIQSLKTKNNYEKGGVVNNNDDKMNLGKDTASRMLGNIDAQLKALSAIQQAMNGGKGESGPTMAKGGRVKMQERGKVPNNRSNPYMLPNVDVQGTSQRNLFPSLFPSVAVNPESVAQAYGNAGDYMTRQGSSLVGQDYLTTPSRSSAIAGTAGGVGMAGANPKDYSSLMGLVGPAFNAIAGAFVKNPKRLNPNDYQNPYESQALSMMPTEFNIEPQRNEIKNQYANYIRNINNAGNSRGERMANYASGMNRSNEASGALYTQKFNEENRMRSDKAQMLSGLGAQRSRINLGVSDMNEANQAVARNMRREYLGAAAEGVGNWSTVNKQMANQKISQDAYIKALMNVTPFMSKWLDENNWLYNKENTRTNGK